MEKGTLIYEAKLKNIFTFPDPYQKIMASQFLKKMNVCVFANFLKSKTEKYIQMFLI